jgi:hypothetical protein
VVLKQQPQSDDASVLLLPLFFSKTVSCNAAVLGDNEVGTIFLLFLSAPLMKNLGKKFYWLWLILRRAYLHRKILSMP